MIKMICGGYSISAKPKYYKFISRWYYHHIDIQTRLNHFDMCIADTEDDAMRQLLSALNTIHKHLGINRTKMYRCFDVFLYMMVITDKSCSFIQYQIDRSGKQYVVKSILLDLTKTRLKYVYVIQPSGITNTTIRMFTNPDLALMYIKKSNDINLNDVEHIMHTVHMNHVGGSCYTYNMPGHDMIDRHYERYYDRGLIACDGISLHDYALCLAGIGTRIYNNAGFLMYGYITFARVYEDFIDPYWYMIMRTEFENPLKFDIDKIMHTFATKNQLADYTSMVQHKSNHI